MKRADCLLVIVHLISWIGMQLDNTTDFSAFFRVRDDLVRTISRKKSAAVSEILGELFPPEKAWKSVIELFQLSALLKVSVFRCLYVVHFWHSSRGICVDSCFFVVRMSSGLP